MLATHIPPHSDDLPHAFKCITMQLAREPQFPDGNPDYGYRLIAPLDAHGQINPDLWGEHRKDCKVVRFKPREFDEVGHLVRKGKAWIFHYDVQGGDVDDTGFRLGDEHFTVGEYISVREHGVMHTFKVTSVVPVGAW